MKLVFAFLVLVFSAADTCYAQRDSKRKSNDKTTSGNEPLFTLNYFDTVCKADAFRLEGNMAFEDNVQMNYEAPKLVKYKTIYRMLSKELRYPQVAVEDDIQGIVYFLIAISKEGQIEKISVKEGYHSSIDAEAFRVLSMMKIAKPAVVNGIPTDVCLVVPVTFRLE